MERINTKSANYIFLALLFILSYYMFGERVPLILMEDELYHIVDSIVTNKISSINPFHESYDFLGHPPFYRIMAVGWFSIFDLSHSNAHLFSIFLSISTLAIFLYYLSQFIPKIIASLAILLTFFLPGISNYFVECQADMPAVFLFFLTLYFLYKVKNRAASLTMLILVLTRESAIALSISLVIISFFKGRENLIKNALITLPSFLGLIVFFSLNYFFRGKLSSHPFALGELSHLEENISFFSIGTAKIESLFKVINIFENALGFYFIIIFFISSCILVKVFKRLDTRLRDSLLIQGLYSLFFVLFFIFFEDSIERDFLPVYFSMCFTIFTLVGYFKNKYCFLLLLILFSLGVYNSENGWRNNYLKSKQEVIISSVEHIEKNYQARKICFMWPIDAGTQKVHGYFKKKLDLECSNKTEVVVLNNLQNNGIQEKLRERVKELGLKLSNRFVLNESQDYWYEVYVK